jgi:hypothetical protein
MKDDYDEGPQKSFGMTAKKGNRLKDEKAN